jgi:diguanylate cyclase (GGDEF)-like protein
MSAGALTDPPAVPLSGPEAEGLPPELVAAAMEDPETAQVIYDSKLRVLHVTSRIQNLLEMRPGEPMESSDVLSLLARSNLDADSKALAAGHVVQSIKDSRATTSLLREENRSLRAIRLKIRSYGHGYRVASFEAIDPQEMRNLWRNEAVLRDPLTGLPLRRRFETVLTTLCAQRPRVSTSVLLLDLIRFKQVNETLGHDAGDSVLRLAARRLKNAVRDVDLVARLDGDEFAVLIHPSPPADQPATIAKRILEVLEKRYQIEGQAVHLGVSIGIARYPADGNQRATLLRSAALALRESRRLGTSRFLFFEAHMDPGDRGELLNEEELRRAQTLHQLEVFYQPQVDTSNNRLIGFEALLRLRHPERGLLPPGDFLPLAEKTGMIIDIGDWVLRTACREAAKWPADLVVSVNASPLQFDTGHFADSVRQNLSDAGLSGERLEIEITEGILLRNDEANLRTLNELHSMLVQIAMDDFGIGHSSLGQFARFPFDKIKIDRSLVAVEGDDIKQRAIVRAIVTLGRTLGIRIIAEGIETTHQLERIQEDGCSVVQGFLFGKAVPAQDVAEVISRWRLSDSAEKPQHDSFG